MELARNPLSLVFFSINQTGRQGSQFLAALLKRQLRSPTFGDVNADRGPANSGAAGVADVKDVVDHPDRLTSFKVSEANLNLAVAIAEDTWKKLIGDERLIFREEVILDFAPTSFFEIVQPDQSHAGGVDIERPEIAVAHANEFQTVVGQRDEFLPLFFGANSFGDVDAGTNVAVENIARGEPRNSSV